MIKLAVEDLDAAHKKVRIWDEKHRKGTLKDYVQKNTGKQNCTPITLTQEDQSAIKFFDPADKAHQLYFGMLDMEDVPAVIQKQRDFVKENRKSLEDKIQYFKRLIVKENEERTNSGKWQEREKRKKTEHIRAYET